MRDYWMESVNCLSAQVCVFESEFVRKPKTAGRRAIGQSKGCGVSLSGRNLAWVPGKLLSQLPAVQFRVLAQLLAYRVLSENDNLPKPGMSFYTPATPQIITVDTTEGLKK